MPFFSVTVPWTTTCTIPVAVWFGSKVVPRSPIARAYGAAAVLKLLDKERRSQSRDFNFDKALGLFAGLNIVCTSSVRRPSPVTPMPSRVNQSRDRSGPE
ncbi:MAG: hypothetical protein L0Z62_41300 [Gemmataceae bacterium]|nr:hypothetical protein [Gemmataceae bacterium]